MTCVELTNSDLAARCPQCRKHIAYAVVVPPMTATRWKAILDAFVVKHNQECRK